ncbi:Aspartate aminotransferase, cytoplasmic [Physocladia obscura]|uniref:aspartate transaminase n=1 Tax=Physocladia obscura TaxID=109957 RepID=A0AAD5T3A4_9FUNG|nr:Aspartate aminotransferase, cytoplasmic [Physocladia obscura]
MAPIKECSTIAEKSHGETDDVTTSGIGYSNLTLQPEDSIFRLFGEFMADSSPDAINLSIGAYRGNDGKPWVLPVVKKAKEILLRDPQANHEYLPLEGLTSFNEAAAKLILGENSPAILEKRYAAVQTVSGTGANRIAAEFFAKFRPSATVYITNPTWGNHKKIFMAAGLPIIEYEYWNPKTRSINHAQVLATLKTALPGSIFLLHACAHNPTGLDPTHRQWQEIADIMESRNLNPFFDCAYQGFASGDLDTDAWAVRYFVVRGFNVICAQSFSKNFGLYAERTGCLVGIFGDEEVARMAKSQFAYLLRCSISHAPGFGANIVDIVFKNEALVREWKENLKEMSTRISQMREKVVQLLVELKTPGDWSHITSQIGMFSYTGLTMPQVAAIKMKFHVYMTDEGRASMAGLNEKNVENFAKAVDWVVRNA